MTIVAFSGPTVVFAVGCTLGVWAVFLSGCSFEEAPLFRVSILGTVLCAEGALEPLIMAIVRGDGAMSGGRVEIFGAATTVPSDWGTGLGGVTTAGDVGNGANS